MNNLPPRLVAALEGRYTLDREIGAGGMATVYLAHDVRHERAVALKVLKPELSAVMGGERFLSEIRTTANLQHPHILPLYDSGNADGLLYYVMPYVEGETLRGRLAREKQLSVDETLRIAKAVGSALDFAHRKGVVHRDIKPANILLQDGQPLVADFGIALAVAQAGGGRLTETGLSLGTPHYMSPEQATADRDPDARSDIYSLGCVVYEMLTGEPPHLGGNAQAVLARILTEAARPVRNVRSTVPTYVDAALSKALQKLPADRFDTAADFLAALEGRIVVDTGANEAVSAASGPGSSGNRRPWLWPALAAAALVVGATAGWAARRPAPTPPPPLVRMYVEGDSTYQVTNACCGPSVAVSRDGQRIAFMAKTAKGNQLFVRGLDDVEAHPVEGTESALTPFFDPTGRWLGFVKDERLMKSDLAGGTPLTVSSVGTSRIWGAAWSEDGFIYYTPQRDSTPGIFRVNAQGGTEELFSAPDTSVEVDRVSPAALPGGRGLLYVSWPREGRDAEAWVGVIDLKDGSSRRLTQGIQPYYANGYLVYALADGSVMARPFDLGSLEITGEPFRLGDDVITHNASDTEYAVSLTGTLVTRRTGGGPGGSGNMPVLRVVSLNGGELKTFGSSSLRRAPAFSPDGRSIAFAQVREGGALRDIWVVDLDTNLPTRLSTGDVFADAPIWSADGRVVRWVQYASSVRDKPSFMSRPADLSGPATPFAAQAAARLAGNLDGARLGLPSRSGGPIPFVANSPDGTNFDVWLLDADGTNPRPFLESPYNEKDPAISPSGQWIAYVSDETGQEDVWVEPFPDRGPRFRITADGGASPVWVTDDLLIFNNRRDDVAVMVQLRVSDGRMRATDYRDLVDLMSPAGALRPLDVRASDHALAVLSQTGTTRLLVETNRLSHLEGTK